MTAPNIFIKSNYKELNGWKTPLTKRPVSM